jgi:hypothetical protein
MKFKQRLLYKYSATFAIPCQAYVAKRLFGIGIVKLSDDDSGESNYLIYELSGFTENVLSKANDILIVKSF